MTASCLTEKRTLQASPEAVDRTCASLRDGLLRRLPRHERFVIELLLREALMNSVRHGCSDGRSTEIRFELRAASDHVTVCVEDDGPGFNWQEQSGRSRDELGPSGHGLHILRHYADHVQFFGKGNRLEFIRKYQKEGRNEC